MATRCAVIAKVGNEYIGIHCHWDGYEDGVGKTLKTNFNSEKDAFDIVALGDCSNICQAVRINPIGKHSFMKKEEEGTIVAYHRDREDPFHQEKGSTWKEVASKIEHNGWAYVWENGKWTTYFHKSYRFTDDGWEKI